MEKGFTLVEIMVVVAIMAILATVSISSYTKRIKKAKDANALAVLGKVRSNLTQAVIDLEGNYPTFITGNGVWRDDVTLKAASRLDGSEIVPEIKSNGYDVEEVDVNDETACGYADGAAKIKLEYLWVNGDGGAVRFEAGKKDSKSRDWRSY